MKNKVAQNTGSFGNIDLLGADLVSNSSVEYTYNTLRNVIFGDEEKLNNYRLMVFEHQEVAGTFSNDEMLFRQTDFGYSALLYEVTIQDKTTKIIYQLINGYKEVFTTTFNQYYETALEECSYNNLDERFKDFFVQGALNTFSNSPSESPWYKMPVLYHLHLDLLFDTHGGDTERIIAAALKESEKIAPETGTLGELMSFQQKAQNLYEQNYVSTEGTSVVNRINAVISGGALESFNDLDRFENTTTFTNGEKDTFVGIPESINLVNTLGDADDFFDDRYTIIQNSIEQAAEILVSGLYLSLIHI